MTKPSDELIEEVARVIGDVADELHITQLKLISRAAYPIYRKAVLAEVAEWLRKESDHLAACLLFEDRLARLRVFADRIEKGDL